jgi:hypothetical protein
LNEELALVLDCTIRHLNLKEELVILGVGDMVDDGPGTVVAVPILSSSKYPCPLKPP